MKKIKEEIKELKQQLVDKANQKEDLLNGEVYDLSRKLDEKILAYYKEEIGG
ncbi:aspartyl-phosphate phosphatase Spo0E family protein [Halanaerobaculum tunisiense]